MNSPNQCSRKLGYFTWKINSEFILLKFIIIILHMMGITEQQHWRGAQWHFLLAQQGAPLSCFSLYMYSYAFKSYLVRRTFVISMV